FATANARWRHSRSKAGSSICARTNAWVRRSIGCSTACARCAANRQRPAISCRFTRGRSKCCRSRKAWRISRRSVRQRVRLPPRVAIGTSDIVRTMAHAGHNQGMSATDVDEAKKDLACALRAAAHFGLSEGICNHFSLAVPGRPGAFLINPQGFHWSELTPDHLVTIDAAGKRIAGKYDVEPTAFFIHSWIHRVAPDAACVLHTHMPFATALT